MKPPHMTATKHRSITKQMDIDGSSSVCSAKCKLSLSINIVKISILIVAFLLEQVAHRCAELTRVWRVFISYFVTAYLKYKLQMTLSVKTLSENRFRRLACGREQIIQTLSVWETKKLEKLIKTKQAEEPIHWFANWFKSLNRIESK